MDSLNYVNNLKPAHCPWSPTDWPSGGHVRRQGGTCSDHPAALPRWGFTGETGKLVPKASSHILARVSLFIDIAQTNIIFYVMKKVINVREDLQIPHSRMRKTCWETLVTCL